MEKVHKFMLYLFDFKTAHFNNSDVILFTSYYND